MGVASLKLKGGGQLFKIDIVYRKCFIEANTFFVQKKEHFIFQLFTMNFKIRMICFLKEKISHKKRVQTQKNESCFLLRKKTKRQQNFTGKKGIREFLELLESRCL